jgi:hypothetical protein
LPSAGPHGVPGPPADPEPARTVLAVHRRVAAEPFRQLRTAAAEAAGLLSSHWMRRAYGSHAYQRGNRARHPSLCLEALRKKALAVATSRLGLSV